MRLIRHIRAPLTMAAAIVAVACGAAAAPPVIAAASDVNVALTDIAAQFTRDSGERVELVFGSSGLLMRQIRDGAPFEVFLSADEAYIAELAAAGMTRDEGTLYGLGRIVLFAPAGSLLVPAEGFEGLRRVLAGGTRARVAIANPEHAPYGRAAEQALRTHGLWDTATPHLVLAENVSQAAQFAASGSTIGGIIAYSLALAPSFSQRGTYALIDESHHQPLRQRMVLLRRSGDVAARFYRYLQEPGARAVFQRYGFGLPQ